jgi:hypothetical protein
VQVEEESMSLDSVEKQLYEIEKKLHKPFPYKNIYEIYEDFTIYFAKLSDDENCLTGDFHTYCMNISGTLSYVMKGKSKRIPKKQIDMLRFSFFEFFPQYVFFKDKMIHYREFYREYSNYEKARKLLLDYLLT